MTKRLLSFLLVATVLTGLLPGWVTGEAEASELLLTPAELVSAKAIAGVGDGASQWHAGMAFSSSMSAMQMADYIDDIISNKLAGLMDTIQSTDVKINRLKKANSPQLITAQKLGAVAQFNQLAWQLRQLYSEMCYYRDQLHSSSDYINTYSDVPGEQSSFLSSRVYYSMQLRNKAALLKDCTDYVSANMAQWEQTIKGAYEKLGVHIPYNKIESPTALATMINTFDEMDSGNLIKELTLTASSMNVNAAPTRMNRITAGTLFSETAHLLVVGAESFGVKILGSGGEPLDSAEVSVTDLDNPAMKLTKTTDTNGNALFSVKNFTANDVGYMHVSIMVTKDGMVEQHVPYALVEKGTMYSGFTLKPEDTKPAIVSATFDEYDMLVSDLVVYYSKRNTAQHKVAIGVRSPVKNYTTELLYTDTEGNQVSAGKKHSYASPTPVIVEYESDFLKRMKPGGNTFIVLETDDGFKETVKTKLVVKRGIVDSPSSDSSSSLLNSVNMDLFSFTFPNNFPDFIAGSKVSIDMSMLGRYAPTQYIPHLGMGQDGTVYFSLGIAPPGNNAKWQNSNQQQYDMDKKAKEADVAGQSALAKVGARWDAQKANKFKLLQNWQIDIGFFVALQLSYFNSQKEGKKDTFRGQLYTGISVHIDSTFTYWLMPGLYASLHLELSVAIGPMLDVGMDCLITPGSPTSIQDILTPSGLHTRPNSINITFECRITLTATVGCGWDGIASLSANVYGYLNFFAALGTDTHIRISAGVGFYVTAKFLFFSWSKDFWKVDDYTLYDSTDDSAKPSAVTVMPKLAPSVSNALSVSLQAAGIELQSPINDKVEFITFGSDVFALYIQKQADGRTRLTYNNLTKEVSGTIEDWFPSSFLTIFNYDYAFCAEYIPEVNKMAVALLATNSMQMQNIALPDGTVGQTLQPNPSDCFLYTMLLEPGADGRLRCISYAHSWGGWLPPFMNQLDGYLDAPQMSVACRSYDKGTSVQIAVAGQDMNNTDNVWYYEHIYTSENGYMLVKNVKREPINDIRDITGNVVLGYCGVTSDSSAKYPYDNVLDVRPSVYYIKQTEASKELKHHVGINDIHDIFHGIQGEITVDTGDITSVHLLMGQAQPNDNSMDFYQKDQLFYLKDDPNNGGQRRLFGATVVNVMDDLLESRNNPTMSHYRVTYTDYDITLPATRFYVQQSKGQSMLYWLSAGTVGENNKTPIAQLNGMYYDVEKDVMSNMFTIANIELENENQSISNVYYASNGECYCTVSTSDPGKPDEPAKVKIIPIQIELVPSLGNEALTLEDTMVSAGKYAQMIFSFENTGNVGICKAKADVLLTAPDASTTVMQTLTFDMLEPDKSQNIMKYGEFAGNEIEKGLYRTDGFKDAFNGTHWNIVRSVKYWKTPNQSD